MHLHTDMFSKVMACYIFTYRMPDYIEDVNNRNKQQEKNPPL